MTFRVFQYPLPTPPELGDLNSFLTAQRIATVQHQVVSTAGGPMLLFVVETVGAAATLMAPVAGTPSSKIDYREVLDATDFALYSRLRTIRKQVAEASGVPVYAIFSNAQLAEMVQKHVATAEEMLTITGIGKQRVEKHSHHFLPLLTSVNAPVAECSP